MGLHGFRPRGLNLPGVFIALRQRIFRAHARQNKEALKPVQIENHKGNGCARIDSHLDEAVTTGLTSSPLEEPDTFWAEQATRFHDLGQPGASSTKADMSKGEAAWF